MRGERPFAVVVADDEKSDLNQVAIYLEELPRLQKWIQRPVKKLLAKPNASKVTAYLRKHYDEIDIVLVDLHMPTPEAGGLRVVEEMASLRASKGDGPQLIIISGKIDAEQQVEQYRRRFRDWFRFITKPVPLVEKPRIYHSEEVWAVALEYAVYDMWRTAGGPHYEQEDLICAPHGRIAREVLPWLERLALTDSPILLVGESGAERRVLAERIHARSRTADTSFLSVNCAAISETFLGSEIFGHERGAFPGAVQSKRGMLETVGEGTVFLDEITEMPAALQTRLVSVLVNGEVVRIGSLKLRKASPRIICAANQESLERGMAANTFRPDLYYQLNRGAVFIPALNERPEDIPLLAEYFLQEERKKKTTEVEGLTAEARSRLIAYSWPGDVAELRTVVFRASLRSVGERITQEDLEPELLAETALPLESHGAERARRLADFTDEEFGRALMAEKDKDGRPDIRRTARALGVPVGSLASELERRGLRIHGRMVRFPEASSRTGMRRREDKFEEKPTGTDEKQKCRLYIEGHEEQGRLTIFLDGRKVALRHQLFMLLLKFAIAGGPLSDNDLERVVSYQVGEPRKARSDLNTLLRPLLGSNLIQPIGGGKYKLSIPHQEIGFDTATLLTQKDGAIAEFARSISK